MTYAAFMQGRSRISSSAAVPVATLLATLALIGVVMGGSHDPIAVQPDAKPADGARLATFALG